MVKKLFKMWGILNALDGTEDDEVYPDDMPELADDDMVIEDEFETDSEQDDEWKLHAWGRQKKTAPLGATTWIKVYDQQQWLIFHTQSTGNLCCW